MDNKQLIDNILKRAKEENFDQSEVYISRNKDLKLKMFEGEIDNYSLSDKIGLGFRGIYNGKMGYSYTEKLDEDSIDMIIEQAKNNANNIDSEDLEILFNKSNAEYVEIETYNDSINNISTKEKIHILKKMEEYAYSLDDRVKSINYNQYGENTNETFLVNSEGLDLYEKSNNAFVYFSVVVNSDNDIQSASRHFIGNDLKKLDYKKIVREAVEEAVSLLDANSTKSDNYKVLFRNETFANLLGAFSGVFSAENVQKNMSLMKGKLDKEVADKKLCIIDNPHLKNGIVSRAFDGEGAPTKKKFIIQDGSLNALLNNLKTAKKSKSGEFGNAGRSSYKSKIDIAPSNFYVKNGDKSFNDIIEAIDKGIMIIDLQGLHSGLNPVSGDFSLSAKGYLIENGELKDGVNQITVSGNFYQMLKDIEEIGNDIKFALPQGEGSFGSPSILIDSLTISGE